MAKAKVQIDEDKKREFGIALQSKLDKYKADRAAPEKQWMMNLRQYRGKYDPEIENLIPETRSKAYPRDTRIKIKAFVARMMEMMFPASDMNWELEVSPIPSVPEDALQAIIAGLEAQEQAAAAAEQRLPVALTSKQIEDAVMAYATLRKDRMQKRIKDQLFDPGVDWPQIVKRVIRSGAIYGIGLVKAPLVRTQDERVFERGPDGRYVEKRKKEKRPYPEFVKIWDVYPDLSAMSWEEQDGLFERIVLTRQGFKDLAKRPGFDEKAIKVYLRDHQNGNYTAAGYENELSQLNRDANPTAQRGTRKFEIFRWFGFWSGHDLKAAGVDIKDADLDLELLSDIWFIDNIVLSADLAPFGDRVSDAYHAYIYSEDEDAGLTGVGLPEEVRDTQMGRCSAKRALYDNMAATAGPMVEVAVDLMKPNTDYKTVHAFKVFEREGDDPATLAYPAVRDVSVQSHIPEILNILKADQEQIDIESNIPSWTLGSTQPLGEAFRTSSNMSMMFGGANMVTKDHTRAFDRFVASVVNIILQWNMEFGPEEDKGDYQVRAKGNISLVAKEVRGAALDQFMTTMTPQERQMLKTREILIERLKARDLPINLVVSPEEAKAIQQSAEQAQAAASQATAQREQAQTQKLTADAAKSQAQAQATAATLQANLAKIMAEVQNLQANSKATTDKLQLETIQTMLEQVSAAASEGGTPYVTP